MAEQDVTVVPTCEVSQDPSENEISSLLGGHTNSSEQKWANIQNVLATLYGQGIRMTHITSCHILARDKSCEHAP